MSYPGERKSGYTIVPIFAIRLRYVIIVPTGQWFDLRSFGIYIEGNSPRKGAKGPCEAK